MRREGLEPSSLAACAPQTHAYTNSATCAKILQRGIFKELSSYFVYILAKKYIARKKTLPRLHEGVYKLFARFSRSGRRRNFDGIQHGFGRFFIGGNRQKNRSAHQYRG